MQLLTVLTVQSLSSSKKTSMINQKLKTQQTTVIVKKKINKLVKMMKIASSVMKKEKHK